LIMWMYIRQWIPHEQFTDKELARLYVQSNIHAAVKSTQRYLKVSPAGVTIDLSINDIYLQYEALIDEATALITAHREDVCS
jgi:hypothetical protein